ncbi:hypothetical protein T484DRAFT_1862889 [Baffinella frigidus]|nr:hypothetical protein T484DRAFT_1862889 [Cryptophyta sp. CCMP2293]
MPAKRPSQAFQVGPYAMERGRYYVGDLQHIFDVTTWDEIIKHLDGGYEDGDWVGVQGKYTFPSGRVVVMFNLPSNGYRVRYYTDTAGRAYYVNCPSIGITLEEGLQSEYTEKPSEQSKSSIEYHNGEDWDGMVQRVAQVVEFEEDFTCTSVVDVLKDGRIFGGDCHVAVLSFGDKVSIDTNGENYSDSDEAATTGTGAAIQRKMSAAFKEMARTKKTTATAKKPPRAKKASKKAKA